METVIVTGGAGFIGPQVVDALVADGRPVVVFDDLSTGNAANVADEADLEIVDIVNPEALNGVIDVGRRGGIFHLGLSRW